MAIEDCGADFLVLDDGFQHLRLKRDLDIVLLDGSRPFGNGRLLPFGPLREPVKELVRAHAFVLTRCSEEAGPAKTEGRLRGLFPDKPVFRTDHAPDQVIFPRRNLEVHPSTVAGTRVVGFAGIARPEGFLKTLEGLGAEVVHFRAFGDHHAYSAAEVRALEETRRGLEAEFLLTTEKDWVRISGLESPGVDLGFLSIQLRFLSDEVGFFDRVGDGLERKRVALASHL
jgi:tetraacyldisaccharide 4'-kinase